jgi:crotonobetainyl-CoA:carnitine CoA-transferase CaiB-like acyl-CoA transferase
MDFPLQNVRVLDLTRLLPGAICTLMLADMGAQVIKVEQPGSGDMMRWYFPREGDYAAIFHATNRNKRSITLDLKKGMAVFKKLVAGADVVIESYRPAAAARLGITYEELRAENPRLVMCSLSGFGQQGDHANEAGHDLNFAGLAGVLAAGDESVLPIQAMDFGGAYLAAFGISTALFQRERSGQGAYVDAALIDPAISMMMLARADSFARDAAPAPQGELLTGGYACYRVYRASDEKAITLAALEPKFWATVCTLIGRDDLARRFHLNPGDQAELIAALTETFAQKTRDEWLDILSDDTCAAPVLDVMQSFGDARLRGRDAFYEADGVAHTRTPFTIGARVPHKSAPILGADTDAVLQSVGYASDDIEDLRAAGIIA